MTIEICKLTPDMLEDYLYFFETDAHADNEEEDRCYCVCWSSADDSEESMSSPEKRRELAIQYVNNGIIKGYLAYCDGKVVGWCNANTKSECMNCRSSKRLMPSFKTKISTDEKVKSIFCFAIAPLMKRKGIATLVLDRICKDAADDGFDYVEAYPNKQFENQFNDFMGPLELYKKSGFFVHEETERKIIMRKSLK
jgi:GNAT superfamily N-acetyltransferase